MKNNRIYTMNRLDRIKLERQERIANKLTWIFNGILLTILLVGQWIQNGAL